MFLPRGKLALVAAGIAVVAAAGGAMFAGLPQALGLGVSAAAEQPHVAETAAPGPMYILKERVVNLADAGGRKYLKVAMSIEFVSAEHESKGVSSEERGKQQAEFEKTLAPKAPIIEDAVISLLTGKSSTDVASPEGKQQLKTEIKDRLNHLLGNEQVTNVYFTQFLMQ